MMSLVRVLLPVAFAWVAVAGCGPGPEGRPVRRGPGLARARARRGTEEASAEAGDPILERIEALARKDSSATKPSLAEMLPPLKSASVPYDIAKPYHVAKALGRRPPRVASRAPAPPPDEKPAPPEAEAAQAAQAKETPVPAPAPPRRQGSQDRQGRPSLANSDVLGVLAVPPPGGEAGDEFRLGPGDEIHLTVDGQSEFSGAVAVREDGTVVLPSTGDPVPASGRTLEELARAVAGAISPRYVKRKPAVSAKLLRSPGSRGGGTP